MTAEPRRVEGVLLTLDDAAYLVEAIDVFGARLLMTGRTLTPRIVRLRTTLAAATHAGTDVDARTPESQHDWRLLSAHDLLDSTQAAALLGCTPNNVRDLARRGAVDAHRSGGRWLFDAAALELRASRNPS